MSRPHKPKAFWRLARIWFRHFRITVWLLVLLLLVVLIYLHNIGLPGFAERMVVRSFAARGVDLHFSRIHLVWVRSFEADDVRVQPSGTGWVPRIECQKLELHFDPVALLRLRIVPQDLAIEGGQLFLPYLQTNGVTSHLTATNLESLIRLEPGGHWTLDSLQGELAGCDLSVSGTIANAELIQDWRILRHRITQSEGAAAELWNTVSQIRNQIEFLSPPSLKLSFDVDGATPEKLAGWLSVTADSALSPWGLLDHPEISARLEPMDDEACSEVEFAVEAAAASSEFGSGQRVALSSTFSCMAESGSLIAGRAALSAERIDTIWAGASNLDVSLAWHGDGTNLVPEAATLQLEADELSTGRGLAEGVKLALQLNPTESDARQGLDLPEFLFADLEPFEVSTSVEIDQVTTSWFGATNLAWDGRWVSPTVAITNLAVDWAGGHLDAVVDYDAISGRLQARVLSSFDPQELYSILPREAVVWLQQFTWQVPPVVDGVAQVTLPEWKPHQFGWPGDLRPSLYLNGQFDIGEGTFNRIPLSGATSHFAYSNMCWSLPDLTVKRPDGSLLLEHRNDDRTREFFWKVKGAVDPTPAMILLPEDAAEAREILGTLWFGGAPEVDLALTGCWSNANSIEAWGTLRATNFSFRGRAFRELDARIGLTNLALTISGLRVGAVAGAATAESLTFDFPQRLAFLSNGVSSMPPMTVATVIGPDVVKAIEAYQFLSPPSGRVDGVIPLKGVAGADMRFDLQGGPFQWKNFNLQEIRARVLWREETVTLTNVQAEFYGGSARGQAFFDFTGKKDADFRFDIVVEDADVQPLVIDVFQSTNRLEGRLDGMLTVTEANTADFGTWFGYGNAKLVDGYLWSAPIFGVLSPVLDLFVPGLGSSRAEEAEGQYVITNSVIRTEDLVIYTSNMRLLYAGTVDFQGAVDAVVEAEILRDALLVGELVSVVLMPWSKAMIIELTGTLAEPKARPLYLLPRVLLAPLNPVQMLRDLFVPAPPEYREFPGEPQSDTKPDNPGEGSVP